MPRNQTRRAQVNMALIFVNNQAVAKDKYNYKTLYNYKKKTLIYLMLSLEVKQIHIFNIYYFK